ncbi:hypothetical protein BaRGS_00017991 [Batillaria attramentaria]|uniref:Palmitoyltransferase n=1 Tax=Batillaria attramentaria TaxID=370345 RepID=A0ABD0KUI7_9CAEN
MVAQTTEDYASNPNLSLREKWQAHLKNRHTDASASVSTPTWLLNTWGPRVTLFVLVGAGVWEMFVTIPALYQGGWEDYILPSQMLLAFLLFEVAVNWCLTGTVSSEYRPEIHGTEPARVSASGEWKRESSSLPVSASKDSVGSCEKRAYTDVATGCVYDIESEAVDLDYAPPSKTGAYDGHSYRMLVPTSLPDEDGHVERKSFPYWSWTPCVICQRPRPPRCYHCPLCKVCVLKRDHHCYISGCCVGANNQRFFHIFVFWTIPLTSFGILHMFPYAFRHVGPEYEAELVDFIFPVCVIRCLLGYVSFTVLFLCCQFWLIIFFNIFSIGMTMGHLRLLYEGRTSFERDNSVKVLDTRTLPGKLMSVFGKYWWLNFLVPLYPRFKPEEDAVLWPDIKP